MNIKGTGYMGWLAGKLVVVVVADDGGDFFAEDEGFNLIFAAGEKALQYRKLKKRLKNTAYQMTPFLVV